MMLRAAVMPHLRALNISMGAPITSPAAYTPSTLVRMRSSTRISPSGPVASPSARAASALLGSSPVQLRTMSHATVSRVPSAWWTVTPSTRPAPWISVTLAPSSSVMPRACMPSTT